MPVEIADAPVPSRSIATSTSVSLVVRLTEPLRMDVTCGQLNGERLVAGVGGVRHFLPLPRVRGRGASEARREGASPRPHAQAASPSPPSPAASRACPTCAPIMRNPGKPGFRRGKERGPCLHLAARILKSAGPPGGPNAISLEFL